MNLAQCKTLHNPQSCRDLGCGHLKVIAGHSPSQIPCRSRAGLQSGAKSVPPSGNKLHSNFLDNHAQKIAPSASSQNRLRLSLSFQPVVAFSSSLKFFRFGGDEESREPSQVLRSIDFQEHVDATKIFLEDTQGSAENVDGEFEYLVNGSEPLQSVDNMANLMDLAAEASGEGADTCMEMVKPVEHMSRPLIQNFVKLRSFWKRENFDREALKSAETSTTATQIESCQFIPSNCGCQRCGACCSESAIDPGNVAVTPHTEIARNKEYFAKFLYRVPSAERKRITQMAHISNLAYRIPTIEASKLLRHHHFRMVTSSFGLKASAPASGNGKDSTTQDLKMKSNTGGRKHDQTEAHARTERIDEGAMASLNPAAGYAMAATAASCNAQACDLLLSKAESDASAFGDEIEGDFRDDVGAPQNCDGDSGILDKDMGASNTSPKNPWYMRTAASILRAAPRVPAEEPETEHLPQGCPCEWFACENDATSTLVISIQGTETLAAWQANLQFEPTQFEPEANTGVMVHRGIYEAAKRLYEEVLPCISAHMEKHGDNGRLQFTGHSLGGSLAMLLSLMVVVRSTAPVSAMLPVYTFGSPCVMCGGNHLLAHLGLPHSHIRSIIMHMDIVPRTFACDYPDHVTVVLKRVSGTFRNHTCLLQQVTCLTRFHFGFAVLANSKVRYLCGRFIHWSSRLLSLSQRSADCARRCKL